MAHAARTKRRSPTRTRRDTGCHRTTPAARRRPKYLDAAIRRSSVPPARSAAVRLESAGSTGRVRETSPPEIDRRSAADFRRWRSPTPRLAPARSAAATCRAGSRSLPTDRDATAEMDGSCTGRGHTTWLEQLALAAIPSVWFGGLRDLWRTRLACVDPNQRTRAACATKPRSDAADRGLC